jgi:cyclopropane-fatty-acyl-phospholipid synthase
VDDVLSSLVHEVLGRPEGLAVEAYDGSRAGPVGDDVPVLVITSPDAVSRVVTRPGELGLARAWVAGDLDVRGDLWAAIGQLEHFNGGKVPAGTVARLLRATGLRSLRRLPPPPEESSLRGHRHSRSRDAASISHHYDVSNEFYRLILGPTMTYSCAVFADPTIGLDEAQEAKYELICQKLGLSAGDRLLDIGCGWGGMVLHAARHHGAVAVGVTISKEQAALARDRVAEAGLDGKVEIRVQDYREIHDGPYDAVSSIGMFEHVGRGGVDAYTTALHALVRPGGRVLNHAISRPPQKSQHKRFGKQVATAYRVAEALGSARATRSESEFMDRYVFPDGELFEVGSVVTHLQAADLEVRHVESLRPHYALTLRRWVANLEANWDEAVRLVGERRARVWRLYMALSARGFERGTIAIHQVLAVRAHEDGRDELPLRPTW